MDGRVEHRSACQANRVQRSTDVAPPSYTRQLLQANGTNGTTPVTPSNTTLPSNWTVQERPAAACLNSYVATYNASVLVPYPPANYLGQGQIHSYLAVEDQNKTYSLKAGIELNVVPRSWSASSWYCCSGGFAVQSQPVVGLAPGDRIWGYITQVNSTAYNVTTQVNNNRSTTVIANYNDYGVTPLMSNFCQ